MNNEFDKDVFKLKMGDTDTLLTYFTHFIYNDEEKRELIENTLLDGDLNYMDICFILDHILRSTQHIDERVNKISLP